MLLERAIVQVGLLTAGHNTFILQARLLNTLIKTQAIIKRLLSQKCTLLKKENLPHSREPEYATSDSSRKRKSWSSAHTRRGGPQCAALSA